MRLVNLKPIPRNSSFLRELTASSSPKLDSGPTEISSVCRSKCVKWFKREHVMTQVAKRTECTTPRMTPDATYGLGVIMVCQWKVPDCKGRAPLMQDVRGGGRRG